VMKRIGVTRGRKRHYTLIPLARANNLPDDGLNLSGFRNAGGGECGRTLAATAYQTCDVFGRNDNARVTYAVTMRSGARLKRPLVSFLAHFSLFFSLRAKTRESRFREDLIAMIRDDSIAD